MKPSRSGRAGASAEVAAGRGARSTPYGTRWAGTLAGSQPRARNESRIAVEPATRAPAAASAARARAPRTA